MENVFLKQFLMISDVRTIAFLAVLAALFYLIHVLYHKKHMDFAAVVMIGTGLGLVLGLAIQFVAGSRINRWKLLSSQRRQPGLQCSEAATST